MSKPSFAQRLKSLGGRALNARLTRTAQRYTASNGALLSAGLALTALLSAVALLTAALTFTVSIIGANEQLFNALADTADAAIPGLLQSENNPDGLLDPDTLVRSTGSWVTAVVALLIALWSATTTTAALGRSIRQIFGLPTPSVGLGGPFGRAVIGVVFLPLTLIVVTALGIVTDIAGQWLFPFLGIETTAAQRLIAIGSAVVSLLIYAGVGWVLIRVVAGVRPRRREMVEAMVIIALSSQALRMAGTAVVQLSSNPLLVTATAIVTVILWMNFQVQAILWACAWAANPPARPRGNEAPSPYEDQQPNFVTMSAPHTLEWPHDPATGAVLSTESEE